MKKITILGVHSAGKTSLAYILSAHFKMKHANVKLIHESVRENCPFPINNEATQNTCLWTFHKQFLNELEAEAQGYGLAICDRSVIDPFVYYHAVNPQHPNTQSALEQASQWLSTYDVIICIEPAGNIELFDDGFRATDVEYQNLINKGFRETLKLYGQHVQDQIIKITSEDIFDLDRRKNLITLVEEQLEAQLTHA
ncbi:MAG: AAA family ATPase [Chlamydiota bacterium]|nr:AAA family ATPase [Chlamydiota bacterium]